MKKRSKVFILALVGLFLFSSLTLAGQQADKGRLEKGVDIRMVKLHQHMLQYIADKNGGNRLAGTAGHTSSAKYVAGWLKTAGYKPVIQEFDFPFFQELSDPAMDQVAPMSVMYPPNVPEGFMTMTYSGSGSATAVVQPTNDVVVPIGDNPPSFSNSGCEESDFEGFMPGNIALVQRGTCSFAIKAQNAQDAGASAVIIFNEGQAGRVDAIRGTLGGPDFTVPVVFANYNIGREIVESIRAGNEVQITVETDTISETRKTINVIADTPKGDDSRTVVVGAHLDSVPEGPGINDNGSGSAAILEVACKLGWLQIKPKYKVRFAFWSAEEEGLLGSEYYVANLSEAELAKISMNLNFDMIASPNWVRFVYDGDGSDTPDPGPPGSEAIEQLFNAYFAAKGLPTDPTALDGRSDYDSFAARNIPVGGLFTGADTIKSEEQVAKYGGTAGEPCDPAYHTADDNLNNLDYTIENQMLKAIAHAVETYSKTPLPPAPVQTLRALSVPRAKEYKGPLAIR